MLELLTAAASGLALGLICMVIAVAIIKRREGQARDDFMANKDHWGM
ncbi:hypothetical protein [Chelativorans sp. YIM 93263]|nr:hypothetical protein [Chelativorans sp. YIM 93263]